MFRAHDSWHGSRIKSTVGTPIAQLIRPPSLGKARLTAFRYLAAVDHTITVLKSLAWTELSADAAADQDVVTLLADPGSIARGDYIAFKTDSTTGDRPPVPIFFCSRVNSVSTLTITLEDNLTYAASAGNRVWFFGHPDDHTGPTQSSGNQDIGLKFDAKAEIPLVLSEITAGLVASGQYDPLLIYSPNDKEPGEFEYISAVYTD